MKTIFVSLIVVAISLSAVAQPGPRPDFTVTAAERAAVIEGAIKRLNENYVFPDTARKMETALRARVAKGEYASITSAKALAEKLTADLREISRDKHLHVVYDQNGVPDRAPEVNPTPEDLARERAWVEKVNFGFEKAERMRGNVGYIEIMGFVPPAIGGETATAAMSFIANTDALIVDLRRNGGGEPAMIAYVMSYLFDQPTHLNDIYERPTNLTQQWWTMPHVPGLKFGGRKPLYVLTSSHTFSGGEEFAYNVKNTKRGTLVGETTGGGAHPVQPYKVSEHFAIGVPFARAINPVTKTNWEGTGVTPDISVPADQALNVAYRAILEKLIPATTDPQRRGQMEQLLNDLKKTP